jgi:hypothetical protein
MNIRNRVVRYAAATVMFLAVGTMSPSAWAKPWPGDPLPPQSGSVSEQLPLPEYQHNCPLRRLGDQLVRCDNLTGAGVAAPSWIPEL